MMLEQFFQRGPAFHDAASIFHSHNFYVELLYHPFIDGSQTAPSCEVYFK